MLTKQSVTFRRAKDNEEICPIICLTKTDWEAKSYALSAHELAWLETYNFQAEPGSFVIILSESGALQRVVCGVDWDDFWTLSSLPSQLPYGLYTLDIPSIRWEPCLLAWSLACYENRLYRSKGEAKRWPELVVPDSVSDHVLSHVQDWHQSIFLVRDLINAPAEDLNPATLAETVHACLSPYDVSVTVIEDLLDRNFPAIHAVGRAAPQAPRLIEATWGNPDHPTVTLVGKGVCFDSGGLDIKSAIGMRDMKKDMGGAAHALGLFLRCVQAKLPLSLRLLIPAVENACDANAYRPGDIIKTRSGLTVEIDNTDAEGRMILCDALTYATETPTDLLINFATLTGAARVAMGPDIPAFFTRQEALQHALSQHGNKTYDPIWPLPLYEPYRAMLKSTLADCTNCAKTGYGGAITAAVFLGQFVDPKQAWVHFDLMAANTRTLPGRPEGGEAQGLRAVFAYLVQRYGA